MYYINVIKTIHFGIQKKKKKKEKISISLQDVKN